MSGGVPRIEHRRARFVLAGRARDAVWECSVDTFSPREVQARVRAGESAEAVAADTGWALDKVLRYAEPLLAERSFMAEQAQTVEVRRTRESVTLYDSCAQVLGAPAIDGLVWDAHRRDDGRWVVTADIDGQRAAWTYDHHGRNLHPLDDNARHLMGATPAPAEEEVDIAEALDLASEVPIVRDDPEARPRLAVVPAQDNDAKPDGTPADIEESVTIGGGYEQETITLPRDAQPPAVAPEPEPEPEAETTAKRGNRKTKGRKGRTSVPSWDEILFGAGRSDD